MRDSVHYLKVFAVLLPALSGVLLIAASGVAILVLLVSTIAGLLGLSPIQFASALIGFPALCAAIIVIGAKRPWDRKPSFHKRKI
ncbi:hypothetical protein SAMN05443249_1110 [Beijerinckia sp. 28-YEA-48]|nr:hypothetical protein SAMN05443249_1110 [Beijerinckia sp. 28-YEA-48]